MMFCPKCGSMLRPKVVRDKKVMGCNCGYVEDKSQSTLIFKEKRIVVLKSLRRKHQNIRLSMRNVLNARILKHICGVSRCVQATNRKHNSINVLTAVINGEAEDSMIKRV